MRANGSSRPWPRTFGKAGNRGLSERNGRILPCGRMRFFLGDGRRPAGEGYAGRSRRRVRRMRTQTAGLLARRLRPADLCEVEVVRCRPTEKDGSPPIPDGIGNACNDSPTAAGGRSSLRARLAVLPRGAAANGTRCRANAFGSKPAESTQDADANCGPPLREASARRAAREPSYIR